MISDIFIRTVGERTTDLCVKTWESIYPDAHITIIQRTPFVEALRQLYQLGQKCRNPWFISCDADILPYPDQVLESIKTTLPNIPDDTIAIVGWQDDWLYGRPREVSFKIYRTAACKTLADKLDETSKLGSRRRPERNAICESGYGKSPFIRLNTVWGSHDKDQWYRDIFRKILYHRIKHSKDIPAMAKHWKRNSHPDYQVALAAAKANLRSDFNGIDATTFPKIDKLLKKLGLKEKDPL